MVPVGVNPSQAVHRVEGVVPAAREAASRASRGRAPILVRAQGCGPMWPGEGMSVPCGEEARCVQVAGQVRRGVWPRCSLGVATRPGHPNQD